MLSFLILACATPDSVSVEERALSAMAEKGGEWRVERSNDDELAMSHTRVQQLYQGVPIWGGDAIVHLESDGSLASITRGPRPVEVNTIPDYTKEEAVDFAIEAVGGWERVTDDPGAALWIYNDKGTDRLVWRVEVPMFDDQPSSPVVFLDAHTGQQVFRYENLQTSCPAAVGSGTAYYSGNVSLNTCQYSKSKSYYLEDTSDFETLSFGSTTTKISYQSDSDNKWTASTQKVAVQAHYNARKVLDYYATLGRSGIDGANGPGFVLSMDGFSMLLTSGVSYSKKYNNAFWSSSLGVMVYGDGDGKTFNPLVSVDISGHEMTHGVVQYTANLAYTGESGGLNEAYADILGSMVERYVDGNVVSSDTWKIGEDAYTPKTAGDALRYMDNPAKDKVSLDYYTTNAGTYDVHYSSGIANLAFYLLSQGGAHPTRGGAAMVGIGADEAAAIWYRALAYYLTSTSTFTDAKNACLQAATDLYGSGSVEYTAVQTSWSMVGV